MISKSNRYTNHIHRTHISIQTCIYTLYFMIHTRCADMKQKQYNEITTKYSARINIYHQHTQLHLTHTSSIHTIYMLCCFYLDNYSTQTKMHAIIYVNKKRVNINKLFKDSKIPNFNIFLKKINFLPFSRRLSFMHTYKTCI